MIDLTSEQIAEYLRRSYAAVDGLWFVKVEEEYGFDAALDIDERVWRVIPKIQARMLKRMAGVDHGLGGLQRCLTTKLSLEGAEFQVEWDQARTSLRIVLTRCPWYDLMVKSGREDLAERVGARICKAEYSVWASEFGQKVRFRLEGQICGGSESCRLCFSKRE